MRLSFLFEECSPESYGRNCLQNCSESCYMSKICDRKTGACDGGCEEGWKPPLCNEGIFGTILCLRNYILKQIYLLV